MIAILYKKKKRECITMIIIIIIINIMTLWCMFSIKINKAKKKNNKKIILMSFQLKYLKLISFLYVTQYDIYGKATKHSYKTK